MFDRMKSLNTDIDLRRSILKTLLYFDIFKHPLKAEEVFHYLDRNSIEVNDVQAELAKLCDDELVFRFDEFYTVQNNASLIHRRSLGNARAERSVSLALKRAQLIASFPFVRGVLASGSLSKGYMDEHSDLDFFIITAPNRLWIARMLLVLFKKIFLLNSHKLFCVNYFIDEEHLELEEQNIFSATELATIMPLINKELYLRLLRENNHWLTQFLPNYEARNTERVIRASNGILKRSLEKAMNILRPRVLEKICMSITMWHWRRRYWKTYSPEDFNLAFKSREYVSKNHPRNYQKKVMDLLASKLSALQVELERLEV
jgi:hypothetical protein